MIRLVRSGVLVAAYDVPLRLLGILQARLQFEKMVNERERGRSRNVSVLTRMWSIQQDGSLVFNCGMVMAIADILNQHKLPFSYERVDRPSDIEYDISGIDIPQLRPEQCQMVKAFIDYEGGQLVSPTGCHAAGQLVMLCDGTTKPVEQVVVGDQLMGLDSLPRTVLQLCRGRGEMVRIVPTKGVPWVVNMDHVLTLIRTNDGSKQANKLIDVTVREWMGWSRTAKHVHKLLRASGVDFADTDLPIPARILGLLLGDGGFTGDSVTFCKPDVPLLEELRVWASENRLRYVVDVVEHGMVRLASVTGKPNSNPLTAQMKELGLWKKHSRDKFIPEQYLRTSYQNRVDILSGLLDTDGFYQTGVYEYSSASSILADQVVWLCRSVGLAAYISDKVVNGVVYYRVSISGELDKLPLVLERKKATERKQKKDVLRTGFSLEVLPGTHPFYGFTLSGDGRYLLDDFTVTHNSGKSYGLSTICKLCPKARFILTAPTIDAVATLRRYLTDQFGKDQVGQVGGGKRNTRRITISTYDSVLKVDSLERVDVFIADEGHKSPADKYSSAFLGLAAPIKRFMFTATPEGRFDKAEPIQEALFGPVVVRIPYSQAVSSGSVVPLRVVVCEQPHGPDYDTISRFAIGPDRDRVAMWSNVARSTKIAEDVRRQMALLGNPQTLVLTQHTEHALRLRQVLPDFEVVYGLMTPAKLKRFRKMGLMAEDEEPLSNAARDKMRKRFETGEASKVIATSVFDTAVSANLVGLVAVTSIPNAPKFIQSMGRASRVNEDKKEGVVLLWRDTFGSRTNELGHRLPSSYERRCAGLITTAKREGHVIQKGIE